MKNPAQDFCSNAVVDMEITKFHLKGDTLLRD